MKIHVYLPVEDLERLIQWGKAAEAAGFGDNRFNKDDGNRRLLNRLRRWHRPYDKS